MGDAFFMAGHAANACLSAAEVALNVVGDADYPKENLLDPRPWKRFRWGVPSPLPTELIVAFDMDMSRNGSFELDANGAAPTDWEVIGSVTVSTDSVPSGGGTKALKLAGADDIAYQDYDVVPGNRYRSWPYGRGDGTDPVHQYIRDLLSGLWWDKTTESWISTKNPVQSWTSTSWSPAADDITIAEAPFGHVGPGKIRVQFERPSSITGPAYIDRARIWPGLDTFAIVYDTIPSSFSMVVGASQTSLSSGFSDNFGTFPANRHRRYVKSSQGLSLAWQYLRLKITSTDGQFPHDYIPFLGTVFMGQRKTLLVNPDLPFPITQIMPFSGDQRTPQRASEIPRYRIGCQWNGEDDDYDQVSRDLIAASHFGMEQCLIVPDSSKQEFVYGRGGSMMEFGAERLTDVGWNYSMAFEDEDFSVRTK